MYTILLISLFGVCLGFSPFRSPKLGPSSLVLLKASTASEAGAKAGKSL